MKGEIWAVQHDIYYGPRRLSPSSPLQRKINFKIPGSLFSLGNLESEDYLIDLEATHYVYHILSSFF